MKRLAYALLAALLLLPAAAAEPDLREQLRDALYTEEVDRDPAAAAERYQAILDRFDATRPLAASALFRLAEIRRRQDRSDDAVTLYQRLLREFPDAEAEARLARQHLADFGTEVPEPNDAALGADPERKELARLRDYVTSAPDLLRAPKTLERAADNGWPKAVAFLLEHGAEPNRSDALAVAARRGFLDICQLLVGHQAPTAERAGSALAGAILQERSGMLEALLDLKLPPDSPVPNFNPADFPGATEATALHVAAATSADWAVRLLAEKGASINAPARVIPRPGSVAPRVTPLHQTIASGDLELLRLLIDLGASVSLAPPPTHLRPLVLAAEESDAEALGLLLEHGADADAPEALAVLVDDEGRDTSLAAIRRLLDAGCDPNRTPKDGVPAIARAYQWRLKGISNGNTQLAKHHRQVELIELLLAHGADPDTTHGQFYRPAAGPRSRNSNVLTDHSLFLPTERSSQQIPENLLLKTVALAEREEMINVGLIGTLLDAGATPGEAFPEVFEFVARSSDPEHVAIAERLLRFRPETLNTGVGGIFFRWNRPTKRLVIDELLLPELASLGGVHALFSDSGSSFRLVEADTPPDATHRLLLDHFERLARALPQRFVPELTTVRADGSDGRSRIPVELESSDPFPMLEEGDVLEFDARERPEDDPAALDRDDLWWQFRRRIDVPIVVEINGQSRPIRLRGDRLHHDPTSAIAPYLPSEHLIPLLWPIDYPQVEVQGVPEPQVRVVREGWGEIPLDWPTSGFFFEPGDLLRLSLPGETEAIGKSVRSSRIRLGVPETTFVHDLHLDGPEATHALPSLVALIADAYAPVLPSPDQTPPRVAALARSLEDGPVPSWPPHPDFSSIRVHRLTGDGTESMIEVDLAEAIATCDEATPPAVAREADVDLVPGDIVMLPLLETPEPYLGFDAAEVRFFRKVLAGAVQRFTPEGAPELVRLDWRPARWVKTEVGILPFAPEEGMPTLRTTPRVGSDALLEALGYPRRLSVERDQQRSPWLDIDRLFLRDGDYVFLDNSRRLTPRNTQRRRAPRVVVPR